MDKGGIKGRRMTISTATGARTNNWLFKAMKVLLQLTRHTCQGSWLTDRITRLLGVDSISVDRC